LLLIFTELSWLDKGREAVDEGMKKRRSSSLRNELFAVIETTDSSRSSQVKIVTSKRAKAGLLPLTRVLLYETWFMTLRLFF
jgi:hypothetical protein